MSDIELVRLPAGTVTLHDARRRMRRTVELEPFALAAFPVTEEQVTEVLAHHHGILVARSPT